MSIPIPDFWRLLVESRLASAQQAQQLREMFGNVKGGDDSNANAAALAQWMTSNGLLSLYQAKVLLSGRAGPFVFGDYLLYDRFEAGRFKSVFRAVHLPTHERVIVAFHTGPQAQIEREWLQRRAANGAVPPGGASASDPRRATHRFGTIQIHGPGGSGGPQRGGPACRRAHCLARSVQYRSAVGDGLITTGGTEIIARRDLSRERLDRSPGQRQVAIAAAGARSVGRAGPDRFPCSPIHPAGC